MEADTPKMERISSMNASDFVYEAIRGVGKVGGYVHGIVTGTMYYTGKYMAHLRGACSGFRVPLSQERSEEGKITIMRLVRNDAAIDEADKREFYMNLGRDIVEATKSGRESENLTIIDLSRYER
jgi:hypothetical protein